MPSSPEHVAAPCPRCGTLVLRGTTPSGETLLVEPDSQTYIIVWDSPKHPMPRLVRSAGVRTHTCHTEKC
jgi:hypothetical protein